jgi:hypothetical protein
VRDEILDFSSEVKVPEGLALPSARIADQILVFFNINSGIAQVPHLKPSSSFQGMLTNATSYTAHYSTNAGWDILKNRDYPYNLT